MRMSLNAPEESESEAESDEEDKRSLSEENFMPDYDMPEDSDEEYVPQVVNAKTHQEKLDELDEEMCQKIQELRGMIGATGGLKKSAAMMDKLFGKGKRQPPSLKKHTVVKKLNFNQNATVRGITEGLKNLRQASRSEETIYKNAVQKHTSSSSEDCIDISNESLNLVDVISGQGMPPT